MRKGSKGEDDGTKFWVRNFVERIPHADQQHSLFPARTVLARSAERWLEHPVGSEYPGEHDHRGLGNDEFSCAHASERRSCQNPPFYNQDWGFADGAQNDIFDYPEVQTTASSSTTSEAVKETPRVKVLAASSTRKADTASPVRTTSREELQEPLNRVAIVTETVTATSTVVVVVTATAEASEHESDSDKRKRSSVERARGPAHHKRRLDGAGLRWTHKLGRRSS